MDIDFTTRFPKACKEIKTSLECTPKGSYFIYTLIQGSFRILSLFPILKKNPRTESKTKSSIYLQGSTLFCEFLRRVTSWFPLTQGILFFAKQLVKVFALLHYIQRFQLLKHHFLKGK